MNVWLFARVLWRFKYLVMAGFVVAIVLSVFTVAKIDTSGGAPFLASRTTPLYSSTASLFLTQEGFPWGSAVQPYQPSASGAGAVPTGDMGRLSALANLYVQFANSDFMARLVKHRAPSTLKLTANQYYSYSPTGYSSAMPILILSATSTSPARARTDTQAAADVLTSYLAQRQVAAGIDKQKRVVVQELERPRKTLLVNPPKKTLPAVVFLTVMLAVVGLAFVLENLRPRLPIAVVARSEAGPLIESAARRTA